MIVAFSNRRSLASRSDGIVSLPFGAGVFIMQLNVCVVLLCAVGGLSCINLFGGMRSIFEFSFICGNKYNSMILSC